MLSRLGRGLGQLFFLLGGGGTFLEVLVWFPPKQNLRQRLWHKKLVWQVTPAAEGGSRESETKKEAKLL